jgi:hypothetical protein
MPDKSLDAKGDDGIDKIMRDVEVAAEFAGGREHTVPNPGSDAALKLGCKCPVLDNGHGRGDGPFWISSDCKMHHAAEWVLPHVQ